MSYGDASLEFYPPDVAPGDCGTFLAVDGALYAPAFDAHEGTATSSLGVPSAFAPVSQSEVSGAGTPGDPYLVTTAVSAPGEDIGIRQTVRYVAGESSYRLDVSVTDERGQARSVRLYHAGDCYASGSDIGYGFTRPEVGAVGCSQNVDNVPAARTIQYSPLSAGSSFLEARYAEVWRRTATRSLTVSFTEAARPAPPRRQ